MVSGSLTPVVLQPRSLRQYLLVPPFVGTLPTDNGVHHSGSSTDHLMKKTCPNTSHAPSTHQREEFSCFKSYLLYECISPVNHSNLLTICQQFIICGFPLLLVVAPRVHVALESHPQTLHTSFAHICQQFRLLQMLFMHGLLLLCIWARIECKLGYLGSVDDVTFKTACVGTIVEI